MTNLADFWQRLLASLIDLTLTMLIFLGLGLFALSGKNIIEVLKQGLWAVVLFFLILPVFLIIFNSFLISILGGTLGKLICGLKIVNPQGKYISFKRALFREYGAKTASNLVFGLGYFWIFKDKERRAWHDQIADTYVVKAQASNWLIGLILLLMLWGGNLWLFTRLFTRGGEVVKEIEKVRQEEKEYQKLYDQEMEFEVN